jgi:hypothetical protein
MSSIAEESAFCKRRLFADALRAEAVKWLPLLLVFAVALIERKFVVANTDVAALITLAERVLDGQRQTVDFIELNPPASIYLYVPGVALARILGLSAEVVTDSLVFTIIGTGLWLAGRILARAGVLENFDTRILAVLVAGILTILPGQIFGEREHIVAAMSLPFLAVLAVRAKSATPDFWPLVAAALGAGVMIVVKPYLIFGVVPAVVFAAYAARSWRVLVALENWIVLATAALYGVVVVMAFPEFLTETVPLVSTVYLPLRNPWPFMVIGLAAVPIWATAFIVIVWLQRKKSADWPYGLLLAASAGFVATFVVQGKGWAYHSYPMLALVLIALALAVTEHGPPAAGGRRPLGPISAFGAVFILAFYWMTTPNTVSMSALAGPIRQVKPHPTMLEISGDPAVGQPLVREVGGRWVGTVSFLWITFGGQWRRTHENLAPATAARIADYMALDRRLLVGDIRRARPDIILVEKAPTDWEAWARADPEIAELLKPYSEVVTMNNVLVLKRESDGPERTGRETRRPADVR